MGGPGPVLHLQFCALAQGPSRSALNVTAVRSHLTWLGVIDDPHAWRMLPPNRKRLAKAWRYPGVRQLAERDRSFPGLAARTLFFDTFINNVVDDGLRQVIILAAGYDSRAWRLARPGVNFFEVDQPGTQEDKRTRAPDGGPVYVPADVTDPRLEDKLLEAGFRPQEPTAFTAEGLTIYLTEADVAELFTRLSGLGKSGSRLAVSFESGFSDRPIARRLATAYYRRSGELWRFRLRDEDAPSFFSGTGWTIDNLLTAPGLEREHLATTSLGGKLRTSSYVVTASR
jgi:methyltransferase (TIGR00027 family)